MYDNKVYKLKRNCDVGKKREEIRELERQDERIREILNSQKPWAEYAWQGDNSPLIHALAH